MKLRFLVPLGAFLVLAAFLFYGLFQDPRKLPSPFIGKPAPQFSLVRLDDSSRRFAPAEMQGQVWLLNVWSSWCVSCRAEHPVLLDMARQGVVPIVGLNYKEVRGDGGLDPIAVGKLAPADEERIARERAEDWLREHGGNPYFLSVLDLDGRVGIDWGVYGVPETFVIDKQGIVRHKHVGPISPQKWGAEILPLVQKLKEEPA